MPARSKQAGVARGFTLIELMVVIAIIAAVLAVALPKLLPAIMYSTHEGAARHLANFGRAAVAHATFEKEAITVKIDLDAQEYWAERLPEAPHEETGQALHQGLQENQDLPEDDDELFRMARDELNKPEGGLGDDTGNAVLEEQRGRMTERFDNRARQAMTARAKRVKHDERVAAHEPSEGMFSNVSLDEEPEAEELDSPLLGHARVPEEVRLVRVETGGKEHNEGVVEIEISPLGLASEARFWLMNEDGDVLVVIWDPVTGRARVEEGRVS